MFLWGEDFVGEGGGVYEKCYAVLSLVFLCKTTRRGIAFSACHIFGVLTYV